MGKITSVVDLTIARNTRVASAAGFGVPMILGLHTRFADFWASYEDTDSMLEAGFLITDAEYKAAAKEFGQAQRPEKVIIGKRTALVAQVDTITPDVSTQAVQDFEVTIDGVLYSFTSDANPTAAEVVAGLAALINADADCPAAATGVATLILTAKTAGIGFSVSVSANLADVATTANHSVADDIARIVNGVDGGQVGNDAWYMLHLTSRTDQDILQAAAEIETRKKAFIGCNSDADVKNGVSDNLLLQLEALGYDRTAYLFSKAQASYPENAWSGQTLPFDPGSETWKFQTAKGVTADDLTGTEHDNIQGHKGNTYESVGGQSMFAEGVVVSGEYIDIIRGIDWLESTMSANVFSLFIQAAGSTGKVPFTDIGISQVEQRIQQSLDLGVSRGLLVRGSIVISMPKEVDVPQADKAARLLQGITWEAQLAGAIHKAKIRGTVVL